MFVWPSLLRGPDITSGNRVAHPGNARRAAVRAAHTKGLAAMQREGGRANGEGAKRQSTPQRLTSLPKRLRRCRRTCSAQPAVTFEP